MREQQGGLSLLSNCAVAGHRSITQCFRIYINCKVGELWQREWVAASEAGRGQADDGDTARRWFITPATRTSWYVSRDKRKWRRGQFVKSSEHKGIDVKSFHLCWGETCISLRKAVRVGEDRRWFWKVWLKRREWERVQRLRATLCFRVSVQKDGPLVTAR